MALVCEVGRDGCINECKVAVSIHGVEQFVTDKSVVVGHVEISGSAIVLPVSNTVADHHSLEVGDPASFGVVDKGVKSKHKLGNVDSSI